MNTKKQNGDTVMIRDIELYGLAGGLQLALLILIALVKFLLRNSKS